MHTNGFISSRRRHTRYWRDWSSNVCSSDLGDRPTERHLHVGVRVDRPRDDVLAARVDHLVGLHVERLPNEGDPLVVDEYVPNVVVGSGDDVTALDQYRHPLFTPLS